MWAKDHAQVYFGEQRVPGADPHGSELLDDLHLRTPAGVFVHGGASPIDPHTVQVLGNGWARDATGVWNRGRRVEGLDVATFRPSPLALGLMEDASTAYDDYASVRPGNPPAACATLGGGYWHDGMHLYYRAVQLGRLDGTPAVIGDGFARIGGQLYFEGVELR